MIYLFYPASFLPHKNHALLLNKNFKNLCNYYSIIIQITIKEEEFLTFPPSLHLNNIKRNSRNAILKYMKDATALLFLSSFESLGLPLIEAALLDKPVICPDLDYSRELLGDSAYYFDLNNFDHSFGMIISNFLADYSNSSQRNAILMPPVVNIDDTIERFFNVLGV